MYRNLRGSFTNQPTSEKNSSPLQNKTIEMENKAMAVAVSLCVGKKEFLEEIMNHQIADECFRHLTQTKLWSKFKNLNLSKC